MINKQWRALSPQPAPDSFVLKVTPQGIFERKPAWKERLHQLGIDLQRIRFIVGSEARTRIFDKALGQAWLLLEPIVMAVLYFFITTVIFTYSGEQRQFLFILTSVVFWRWFSRTIDGAPLSIIGYGAVLKQTRFPVIMVVLGFMATETFPRRKPSPPACSRRSARRRSAYYRVSFRFWRRQRPGPIVSPLQ